MPTSTASVPASPYAIDGTLLAEFIKQAEQEAGKIISQNIIVQTLHTDGRPNNSPKAEVEKTLRAAAILTKADSSCLKQDDGFPFFGERIKELVGAVKSSLR